MRLPCLAGQPINDNRDRVAGVVDEQLVAGRVILPHRHRQLHRPAAVEVTEATVAIALRITADVFVPKDLQRHMLALQLAVDLRPVRLRAPTMTRLRPGCLVKRRFQDCIADVVTQRPR